MRLGDCYDSTGEYEKAAAVYGEGYEVTTFTGEQRATLLSRRAQALRKDKLFEKAEDCLTEGLKRADSDGDKAEVEKLLATLYEDWGSKTRCCCISKRPWSSIQGTWMLGLNWPIATARRATNLRPFTTIGYYGRTALQC